MEETMNYDRVIGQAFSAVWRYKSLWLLGCVGVLLAGLGSGIGSAFQLNWQADFQRNLLSTMFDLEREMTPQEAQEFFQTFMGSMVGIYAVAGVAMLMAFLGYLVSLVTRGAIIDQAVSAATVGTVDWRRGLQVGLSRAPYVFLIDLAWWLPGIVLIGGLYVCGLLGIFGGIAATVNQAGEPNLGVLFGSIIGFICVFLCAALLYGLAMGLVAPMMYQHTVQRRAGVFESIRAGWRIASANLGPMFILLVVSFLLTVVLTIGTSIFSLTFSGLGLSFMFSRPLGELPGAVRLGSLLLAGLGYAVVYTLLGGFVEAVRLAIYTNAYLELSG
jgi:hypothetical protein